jgi:hypothetical protein
MSDSCATEELAKRPLIEYIANESGTFKNVRAIFVKSKNTCCFLPPVLKCIQTQERAFGSRVQPTHTNNSTLLSWSVVDV